MKDTSQRSGASAPVGKSAYEAQLLRAVESVVVDDEDPRTIEIAKAFSLARQRADAGDYLSALQAIRGLQSVRAHTVEHSGPTAGDVEQALGDLRRRIAHLGGTTGSVEAGALWRAAREEVIEGGWEGAMALISEANEWLDQRE